MRTTRSGRFERPSTWSMPSSSQEVTPGGPSLVARAAVMTGEAAVAVGAVGQGLVSGELVSAASRLQGLAPAGGVLIDDATHRATASAIASTPIGEQRLRGRSEPVTAWRATGVIAMRGGGGKVDRLEPPFVGRDPELRLLKDVLHAVDDELRARLVSVTGIAGIGKSRLAWELEKYVDGIVSDVYWHQGRSPAYGEGIAFWALAEMVRGRAGIAEGEDAEATQAKLTAALAEYVPDEAERRAMVPWLLALFGLREAREGATEEAFAAARRLIERIAERGVAVFVFEDLQWADDGLIDFIESVLEWSRNHRILIVTLARPELLERRPTWGAGPAQLHRPPPRAAARRGDDPAARRRGPGAAERRSSGGSSSGPPGSPSSPSRRSGCWSTTDASSAMARPSGSPATSASSPCRSRCGASSVARLDGLDADDRALIQDAAVLGQTFTVNALAALTGRSAEALAPSLRSLVRREILARIDDPGSPERGQYGFVQGVIREVAYETLARKERRARHLAAARYFETLDSDELAGVLASHYVDAYRATPEGPEADALAAQARVALRGAAERAIGSRLARLGPGVPRAGTHGHDRSGRAVRDLGGAPRPRPSGLPGSTSAERYGRLALDAYRDSGDEAGIARAAVLIVQPLFAVGKTSESAELLEAALADCRTDPDAPEVVTLRAELGRALMVSNDRRGIELVERSLDRGRAAAPRPDRSPTPW